MSVVPFVVGKGESMNQCLQQMYTVLTITDQTTSITSRATLPLPRTTTSKTSFNEWPRGTYPNAFYDPSITNRVKSKYGEDVFSHPDDIDDPPYNSTKAACYSSWLTYVKEVVQGNEFWTTSIGSPTITSTVYGWETVISSGPNTTYRECDGIPRLNFTGQTSTTRSLINVTLIRDDAETNVSLRDKADMVLPVEPTCEDLDKFYCRKLWGMSEINGEAYGLFDNLTYQRWPAGLSEVCSFAYTCKAGIQEVLLLHFPENVVSRNVCDSNGRGLSITRPWSNTKPVIFTTSAITFRGQDLYLRRINGVPVADYESNVHDEPIEELWGQEYYGTDNYLEPLVIYPPDGSSMWTFTSPNVYLAHRSIEQTLNFEGLDTDWPLGIEFQSYGGMFRSAGIISIAAEDISTARPIQALLTASGIEYAQLIAKGSYLPTLGRNMYAPMRIYEQMNLGDLKEPMPASIYYDARSADCWGNQKHCGTMTAHAYRPRLRLAPRVWSLLLNGSMCQDPLVADPPIEFRRIEASDDTSTLPQPSFLNPSAPAPFPTGELGPYGVFDSPATQRPGYLPRFGQNPEDIWRPGFGPSRPAPASPSMNQPRPGQAPAPYMPLPTPAAVNRPRPLDQLQYYKEYGPFWNGFGTIWGQEGVSVASRPKDKDDGGNVVYEPQRGFYTVPKAENKYNGEGSSNQPQGGVYAVPKPKDKGDEGNGIYRPQGVGGAYSTQNGPNSNDNDRERRLGVFMGTAGRESPALLRWLRFFLPVELMLQIMNV
jgi:hypothetical protein